MKPNPLRTILNSNPNDYYPIVDTDEQDANLQAMMLNWSALWAQDHSEAEWLAEPIIAKNRSHAMFAPGGTGKSLFSLWLAVRLATGGSGLTGETLAAISVVYIDYEMTESDLAERLESMGYGPDTDLTNLHYALLPSLSPFDTAAGGKQIVRMAEIYDAELVIIDTFSRAVEGDENDADTTRAFYRHTGLALKSANRAFIRIDHAGKDLERGQRGSSAKNDDVDVVWQMVKADDGFTLTARKRRMGWVPETVALAQHDEPTLHYSIAASLVPAGTAAVVKALDDAGIDPHATNRAAAKILREAGWEGRNVLVAAAQKARKQRPIRSPNPVDNPVNSWGSLRGSCDTLKNGIKTGTTGEHVNKPPSDLLVVSGDHCGDHWGSLPAVIGDHTATPVAGSPTDPIADPFNDEPTNTNTNPTNRSQPE